MTCKTPRIPHVIRSTGLRIARRLRGRDDGKRLCAHDLALELGVSDGTARRALYWLRDDLGAPLQFDRYGVGWTMTAPWRPVLELPDAEDVAALHTVVVLADEVGFSKDLVERLADLGAALERRLGEVHG